VTETIPIETRALKELKPAPYNPRKKLVARDKEFQDIKASIERWGYVEPIVWNKRSGNVVGGHQRLSVLKSLKVANAQVAVVDLDDTEERALNVALNRIEGAWDQNKLSLLIAELSGNKFDITRLGFRQSELDEILGRKAKLPKQDPDSPSPIPEKAVTKPGDLYELESGDLRHRLLCGDSASSESYERVLGNERADLIFTDPPYGVRLHMIRRGRGGKRHQELINDGIVGAQWCSWLQSTMKHWAARSDPDAALYCFYASSNEAYQLEAVCKSGWRWVQQLIWVKQFALGRDDYHWAHEPLIYAFRQGGRARWHGDRSQTTVWELNGELEKMTREQLLAMIRGQQTTVWHQTKDAAMSYLHPTQKPVSLAAKAFANSTQAREIVLDPFGGSGSTLIAAELNRRQARLIEIEPRYCDAIINRYRATFDQVSVTKNGKVL
jgi:DNA modification methylase